MGNTLSEQLKSVQIEMLKIFISICEEYHFQYFLIGGSCLGAVRHGGYIPWDDDIDIGMPREDYECFSEIANKRIPDHLFFQTVDTEAEYPNTFGKIRNSNTTYIETSAKNLKINHGVYIDIFPLDGMANNYFLRKIANIRMKFYNTSVSQCFFVDHYNEKNLLKKCIKKIVFLLYPNVKKNIQRREKFFRKYSYSSSEYIANFGGAWGMRECMPKNIFGKGVKFRFENIDVMIPEKYDEYLTRLYGDYMIPPPPEKQIGHHYYEIADINRSYKEYLKEKSY